MDLQKGMPTFDAMHLMDIDDMMEVIRALSQRKELLSNAIETKNMKVDALHQILGCSSITELESVTESSPYIESISSTEQDLLVEYNELVTEAKAALFMDGVMVHELDDLTIFVTFTPPPGKKYCKKLKLTLTPNDNNTYSLCHHNLPDSIPIRQLAAEYMEDFDGEDGKDGVRKFINSVSQYVTAYFIRYTHVSVLEESKMLSSSIYSNNDCSVVSILIEMFAEGKVGASQFEYVLQYDPLDIFPQRVDVRFLDGVPTSTEVKELLHDAALDMKKRPFPNVISMMFSEPESSVNQEESGTSSSDTVIFDFK